MKKLLILTSFCLFMLTGCGATETMSCSFKDTTGYLTTKINYDIDYQKDDVKKVRITYDYDIDSDTIDNIDGVGTGTDGTTNDTQRDDDGVIDGVVGSAVDTVVGVVTDIILDSAGLRERHDAFQNNYVNTSGFSVMNTTDVDNDYKVTYVVDFDTITDNDINSLNLSRDLNTLKNNYINQGFTCK